MKVKQGALDKVVQELVCLGPVTVRKQGCTEIGVIPRSVEDGTGGGLLVCEFEQIDECVPRGAAGAPFPERWKDLSAEN